eukprot:CAMPEP_0174351218 /NCGR_PEP_ID=MMETSP0811_2-20130205/8515_1 /TAXON_ID=73025 ORGANISM="Eutreptiella gymnastica-like, Strain CCMP1594" /NCGR_SAMPLE_ID=MMETSP0811_2 /ASSEMBLY_ACC=CAM_ASM_000667 /LENGTH=58 /DNA_ID=CAMNT_0015480225 /DNA_START=32 /DNA_END=208 /DNA_ORIENTATION=-
MAQAQRSIYSVVRDLDAKAHIPLAEEHYGTDSSEKTCACPELQPLVQKGRKKKTRQVE